MSMQSAVLEAQCVSAAANGCANGKHSADSKLQADKSPAQNGSSQTQTAEDEEREREAQRKYWQEHTPQQPTVETMMLDSKAGDIDRYERPEVLSLLGSVKGQRVLELGAGIGRFTGELCKGGAGRVLAVDFMEASIAENQRLHGHLYPDVLSFKVEDATKLQLPDSSIDVCFTNWLLMYLGDKEVAALAASMLRWLSPGGVLFFRESCFKQSGDKPRKDNPTHYRNPKAYFSVFDSVKYTCPADGKTYQLELLFSKCVDTYVKIKNNQNQICWKWRKVEVPADGCSHALRHFLDGAQYSMAGLAQYEAVFGRGFISCGGETAAKELLPRLELQRGDRVLDVGCGTGGAAAMMSTQYGAAVHGLDLSVNCLLTCLERASLHGCDIVYEVADVSKRELPAASYDVVHCRDVMLHVEDKAGLLDKFFHCLRPGGRLLITDYVLQDDNTASNGHHANSASPAADMTAANSTSNVSADAAGYKQTVGVAGSEVSELQAGLQQYLAQRGYCLWSAAQYRGALQAAGFTQLQLEDRTDELEGHLERELSQLQAPQQQEALRSAHGAEAYQALVDNWQAKLARARAGLQRWLLVLARKPQGDK